VGNPLVLGPVVQYPPAGRCPVERLMLPLGAGGAGAAVAPVPPGGFLEHLGPLGVEPAARAVRQHDAGHAAPPFSLSSMLRCASAAAAAVGYCRMRTAPQSHHSR